jgi:DNA polymerase III epsilon subunit family exonuclease
MGRGEHLFRETRVRYGAAVQRSFDELGTPLAEVTFCVLDLETTGGSASDDAITEIGAVKVRGGECLGTFHTLVHPGRAIPPAITVLTGITDAMVAPAPRLDAVLPALVEFVRGAVVVGHNVRFDLGFLRSALTATGWAPLANRWVDTCALARRLVRDEVPNCRLHTLATRFRLDHRPSHRALDDALATTDLLHLLLERAASWGVLGLDDLLALPGLGAHPQAAKLRLTVDLPRAPGVYQFVDARGEVLYVGKAANLRQRVRSYFGGDERRKIGNLLRETRRVRHHVCTSAVHAAVLETRLIRDLRPRYNRRGTRWPTYPYVKLTLTEAFPRLVLARVARTDGDLYVGPLPSRAAATLVIEAIQTAAPLRRCSEPRAACRHSPGDAVRAGAARRRALPLRGAGRWLRRRGAGGRRGTDRRTVGAARAVARADVPPRRGGSVRGGGRDTRSSRGAVGCTPPPATRGPAPRRGPGPVALGGRRRARARARGDVRGLARGRRSGRHAVDRRALTRGPAPPRVGGRGLLARRVARRHPPGGAGDTRALRRRPGQPRLAHPVLHPRHHRPQRRSLTTPPGRPRRTPPARRFAVDVWAVGAVGRRGGGGQQ